MFRSIEAQTIPIQNFDDNIKLADDKKVKDMNFEVDEFVSESMNGHAAEFKPN